MAPTASEAQRFRFTRLGLEDGLSQASVHALVQDGEGFLWVGTQNGLNRYDGRAFRFRWGAEGRPSPVSFAFIQSLFVDAAGRLWVGTDSYGLYVFERSLEAFEPVPLMSRDASMRPPERVWGFAHFGGRLAVATSEGLTFVDEQGERPVLRRWELSGAPGECGTAASALWAASPTELWLGTEDGCLLRLDSTDENRAQRLADLGGLVRQIEPGAHGGVWVNAEDRGVFRFNRSGEMSAAPSGPFGAALRTTALLTSRERETWVGTARGLARVPAEGGDTTWFAMGTEERGELPHEFVTALFEDRQGVIWVGTWQGLARVSPFRGGIAFIPTPSFADGPALGGVVAIQALDTGEVRVGMMGGGLAIASLDGSQVRKIDHPDMADVLSLATGADGDLWVATVDGVRRRTSRGWRHYRAGVEGPGGFIDTRAGAVTVDRTGAVWIGTIEKGLGLYDAASDRIEPFTGPGPGGTYAAPYLWPIVEDAKGALWFGANGPSGGIHRLSPDRTQFSTFITGSPARPNAGRILTLYVSGDSLVWFGTQGGGLGRLDPRTGDVRFYTEANGLPHDIVPGVLEDDAGNLWVATNDGLGRFDPGTEQFWVFRERSGIQANRFFANASLKLADGRLLFGGPNGVSVITPSNIVPRDEPPPVALTSFRVRGAVRPDLNHVTAQYGVELGPDENFFTIEFAALDFTDASLNAYRYRLDDLDPDWIAAAGENTATYTSVPPARYTFRVQARNSEGVWNRAGLAIPVLVRPPYYATWWFRLAVAATAAISLWAAYRARMAQLARVRALRLRITGDLHDDIGANLSAIALKSELLQRPQTAHAKRQSSLADIERLARETTQKVREMIWVVKEEHDTTTGLIDRMEDAASTLLGGVIDYTFLLSDSVPRKPISMEVRQDVYRVFKEMLQNVLKHSEATHVSVEIDYFRAHLIVTVLDDGVGFREANATSGNGLGLMRQRAEKHRGVFELDASPGMGTRVTLKVEVR